MFRKWKFRIIEMRIEGLAPYCHFTLFQSPYKRSINGIIEHVQYLFVAWRQLENFHYFPYNKGPIFISIILNSESSRKNCYNCVMDLHMLPCEMGKVRYAENIQKFDTEWLRGISIAHLDNENGNTLNEMWS